MHAALKMAAPIAVLTFAAVTLSACVLEPAPYYGGDAYYAQPAPVYVAPPRYHYGSRWGYWHRRGWHGGGWHGGGWHGGGHH
jgi:uncharacterized membrane protein YgcG